MIPTVELRQIAKALLDRVVQLEDPNIADEVLTAALVDIADRSALAVVTQVQANGDPTLAGTLRGVVRARRSE